MDGTLYFTVNASGSPFYEVRLADAEDHVVLKAWSDSPEFTKAEQADRPSFAYSGRGHRGVLT